MDFVKIKNFYNSRDMIKKVKRKEMLANQISEKGLVSRIYKEPLRLNNKNINNPI